MPLFLSVDGIVVNVGAVGSHAAIMCREPRAAVRGVGVIDVIYRIPDGATIEIDGSTGKRMDSLPCPPLCSETRLRGEAGSCYVSLVSSGESTLGHWNRPAAALAT